MGKRMQRFIHGRNYDILPALQSDKRSARLNEVLGDTATQAAGQRPSSYINFVDPPPPQETLPKPLQASLIDMMLRSDTEPTLPPDSPDDPAPQST